MRNAKAVITATGSTSGMATTNPASMADPRLVAGERCSTNPVIAAQVRAKMTTPGKR